MGSAGKHEFQNETEPPKPDLCLHLETVSSRLHPSMLFQCDQWRLGTNRKRSLGLHPEAAVLMDWYLPILDTAVGSNGT